MCLFDFWPTAVLVPGRVEQLIGWFGVQQKTWITVWLEIDRSKVLENLWDAATARQKWDAPPYGEFIHGVEACHNGSMPVSSIARALIVDGNDLHVFKECDISSNVFEIIDAFELSLSPSNSPTDRIVEILTDGRRRNSQRRIREPR